MDASNQHVLTGLTQPELQQPLRTFMLPHLAPQALLALRQACQATQQCVDNDTVELWSNIALRLGVPLQQVPDPWDTQAVHAALNQQAALVSRVRCWDASSASPHGDLLNLFCSTVQLKLSWVGQCFVKGDSRYLVVHDGIADNVPCYNSETESGRWEITFPSTAASPHP